MIESLHIRNFQSLYDVHLELGAFTVIVGRSSSGKSALTRALRVLIENQRGNSFIAHGERLTTIEAKTSHGTVTLQRGKATDDNHYVIVPSDPGHKLAPQQKWTKLGGETPKEVSEFLGINPDDPIAFASQFDKPYLLDERPSEVARVLGELTNVRVIFDAARESNRQKLAASAALKIKVADLAAIKDKIPAYRALKDQVAAIDRAEDLLSHAQELAEQISELESAIDAVEINRSRVEALSAAADIVVPDEEELVSAYTQLAQFRKDLKAWVECSNAVASAEQAYEEYVEELDSIDSQIEDVRGQLGDSIEDYMRAHGKTIRDSDRHEEGIELEEAATLAWAWVEESRDLS